MIFLKIIICYLSLYIVIWMHEVGHAACYWKFGCKKNMFHVTVKPYLFFSTPAPVDETKLNRLSSKQNIIIAYGGVVVNTIFTIIMFSTIKNLDISNEYLLLFIWTFFTLHMAEAVSYLFIGNIYLVSDMANIASENKNLRFVNLFIGILFTIFYLIILFRLPMEIKYYTIVSNLLAIFCMGVGRIIFTYKIHAK